MQKRIFMHSYIAIKGRRQQEKSHKQSGAVCFHSACDRNRLSCLAWSLGSLVICRGVQFIALFNEVSKTVI
jgi:hypothetical protein